VLCAYVVATLVLAAPFVNYAHLASAVYSGDTRLILWTLAWDSHAILNGLPLFHANIFYPATDALACNEHLFGLALFYLPIYAATRNPVLAYNALWLAAWVLNGLAAHALARRYLRDDLAALVGGLVFAFSFFRMLHAYGHLSLEWTFWIPLSLVAMERWYRQPGWRRVSWLTVTIALQVLANWYLAVLALLANSVFLACLVLFDRNRQPDHVLPTPDPENAPDPMFTTRPARGRTLKRVAQGAVAVVVLFLAVWPFARHYRDLGAAGRAEAARYSADATAYLMPAENTWPGQLLLHQGVRGPRWIWEEGTLYLGFVALALAGVGLVVLCAPGLRRRFPGLPLAVAIFFPLIGLVALVLSLGPSIGHGPFPRAAFDWFSRLPGVGGLRAPARFALLVVLALSVLSATGAAWLHQRFRVAGRAVTLLLIPLMLSEWYVVALPGGKPQPESIPAVYERLRELPARAIVSLPLATANDWTRESDYLYYSTAHWHPIVNGFGRTEPADHHWIAGHMRAFPGHNSARTMRRLGIDYVVLHAERQPEGPDLLQQVLRNRDDFELVAQSGQQYLFKVLPADTPPPAGRTGSPAGSSR
jgi:hypothetical protein